MAQHDYVIANGSGSAVRSDLNNALAAIVSHNSGTSEPTTTYAYMPWADTSAGVMKLRNGANNAWITLYQLDGEYTTIPLENGTAAAPSLYFKTSGTDTGLYSPGTDQVAISTAGTGRLFVGASGDVGFGASSPSNTAGFAQQVQLTGSLPCFTIEQSNSSHTLRKYSIGVDSVGGLGFWDNTASAHRFYIDTSGRFGVGTSSPNRLFESSATTVDNFARINTTGATKSGIEFANGGTVYGQLYFNNVAPYDLSLFQQYSTGSLIFGTNNTERLRIASSGALGLAGANYGSSGQALTSNGSSSAPTWQSIPAPAALSTASGSAPSYSARAWVNFNGTGTVAIRASGNVSSITDNGTGDYTVNFATAMADADYAVAGYGGNNAGGSFYPLALRNTPSAGSIRVNMTNGANANQDQELAYVIIFR